MATPSEKLASSLEVLHKLQASGSIAIRSSELTRTHRERLVRNGFLEEVIKGWYVPARPDETAGESTTWYASFWQFCSAYLNQLRGDSWVISPEQSISLHTENWTVPQQLLVRATNAANNLTNLPHATSLLDVQVNAIDSAQVMLKDGVRIYNLPAALIQSGERIYTQSPSEMRTALSMISDASEVLGLLLEGGHSTVAGRLAGAFRNIGRDQIADNIVQTMRAADYNVRENDPFEAQSRLTFSNRERSPFVNRIRLMWQEMRQNVIKHFPSPPVTAIDDAEYLHRVDETYQTDAYHSLSIEGYRVTPQLIEQVRTGDWSPEQNSDDQELLNGLAARGYWQAFQAVRASIEKILSGHNAGQQLDNDHRNWYQQMFAPGVVAGITKPSDLAGYRSAPVFIRRSKHVPANSQAVRDAMPAFFELLSEEENAAVRVVLGHFIFVYIHPYTDGNGRMARFLMNAMLASGGYPWTVIPLQKRTEYMQALEEASVNQNIEDFTKVIGELVKAEMESE